MKNDLKKEIDKIIAVGLQEDSVFHDVTTLSSIEENLLAEAEVTLEQKATIAGLPFLSWIFEKVDPSIQITLFAEEGQTYEKGKVLFKIEGNARVILSTERLLLNLLQHASGIATKTAEYVQKIEGCSCEILDTRKTLPGLRALQKYAVSVGGGTNHRFSLEDLILLKDNHLEMHKAGASFGIKAKVEEARNRYPNIPIEVEVETLAMLEEALLAKPDRIMLDNMSVEQVRQAVSIAGGAVYLEASGGITLDTVRSYAETGVNGVSIGALTHSTYAVSMSMSTRALSGCSESNFTN